MFFPFLTVFVLRNLSFLKTLSQVERFENTFFVKAKVFKKDGLVIWCILHSYVQYLYLYGIVVHNCSPAAKDEEFFFMSMTSDYSHIINVASFAQIILKPLHFSKLVNFNAHNHSTVNRCFSGTNKRIYVSALLLEIKMIFPPLMSTSCPPHLQTSDIISQTVF